MTRENLLSRISIDPNICFGKPCIRGHRIHVSLILDYLAGDAAVEEVLSLIGIQLPCTRCKREGINSLLSSSCFNPWLEREDVQACLVYAPWLVGHEQVKFLDNNF